MLPMTGHPGGPGGTRSRRRRVAYFATTKAATRAMMLTMNMGFSMTMMSLD